MISRNINLLERIYSYLTIQDLANLEVTNRKNKEAAVNFNYKWREECNTYFFTGADQYNVIFHKNKPTIPQDIENIPNEIQWKTLFRQGVINRNKFKSYDNPDFPYLSDEMKAVEDIFFVHLKEHFSLPLLRKENIYVENDINTCHQKFNYDIISNQSELYEYYDQFFKNGMQSKLTKNSLRADDFLFSELLFHFSEVFASMIKDEKSKDIFLSLRWYEYINVTCDKVNNNHPIIFTLANLQEKIKIFAEISINYITKYKEPHNLEIFLNEYLKRYQAFSEAAVFLDGQMENLNVMVNYLYEALYPNLVGSYPKFSIYRMMMTIWIRDVTLRLLDNNNQDSLNLNLMTSLSKLFYRYMESEMTIFNEGNEIGMLETSLSCDYSKIILRSFIELLTSSILDIDCHELSVFFLNHTQFNISDPYRQVETVLSETMTHFIQENLMKHSHNIEKYVLHFFHKFKEGRNSIRFINRTKLILMKALLQPFLEESMINIIQDNFPSRSSLISRLLNSPDGSQYSSILNKATQGIKQALDEYFKELQNLEKGSQRISKENKRRGVALDIGQENEILFSYSLSKAQVMNKVLGVTLDTTPVILSQSGFCCSSDMLYIPDNAMENECDR